MLSATELLRDEVRARDEASSTADERTAFNCDHARRGTETKERRTPLSSSSECNAMVVSQSNSRFDFFPPHPLLLKVVLSFTLKFAVSLKIIFIFRGDRKERN